jgi:hypothetical protein
MRNYHADGVLARKTILESAMKRLKMTAAAAATALLISACSQQESEQGVIPEGYKSAVEKAQGVEGTLEDTMQMHGEQMEERER